MKIQCDFCNKDEATVYCSADEAALCDTCDHRVHHANKLAGKHRRFSLIHPSSSQEFPLCDVCQEKKAFLFCQQDRAILCVDCDFPIHKANEHTQKHNRFLLTGVKLSASTALYSPTATTIANKERPTNPNPSITAVKVVDGGSNNTSSISEYLMETLPGWGVEDFLDTCPASIGLSKSTNDGDLAPPIWDVSDLGSFSSDENVGIWVPQAPPCLYSSQYPSSANIDFSNQVVFEEAKNGSTTIKRSNRDWEKDDGCFIVPQISPSFSVASKRSRTLW